MIRSILFFLMLFLLPSCSKDDPVYDFTTSVSFKTQHHERAVPFLKVYMHYHIDTFPGYDDFSDFDTMLVSDSYGDVTFPKVPFGKHWVIGIGEDDALMEPVRGGLPFEILTVAVPWDTTLYVSEY